MSEKIIGTILGGAAVGLIALALDYFLLQHWFRTPISMAGGIGAVPVLIYLVVPFLVLFFGRRDKA